MNSSLARQQPADQPDHGVSIWLRACLEISQEVVV
jgi:hypothetical protein